MSRRATPLRRVLLAAPRSTSDTSPHLREGRSGSLFRPLAEGSVARRRRESGQGATMGGSP